MSWLKRIEPVVLRQSSDIPYIVLDDGILLCFNNYYGEKVDEGDYFISLYASKNKLKRASTNYYSFKQFPTEIAFCDIIELDNNTIIEGRIIKSAAEVVGDPKGIAVVKMSYVRRLKDDEFQEFVDGIDNYHKTFLLIGENIDPQARLLSDITHMIPHQNWIRTSTIIAHNTCDRLDRKYCWSKSIPEITIACYGFQDTDEMDSFVKALELIGVPNFCTTWE